MLRLPTGEPGVKDSSELHFITPSMHFSKNLFFPGCVGHFYLDNTYCFSHNMLQKVSYPQKVSRTKTEIFYEETQHRVDAQYMFMYVVEGTLALIDGNPMSTTVCGRSSCIVVEHERAHTYYSCSDAEVYFVLFGGNCTKELIDTILEFGSVISIKRPLAFHTLMKRLYTETISEKLLDDIELSSLMYSLIAEVYVSAINVNKKPIDKIGWIQNYIQQHYSENISMEQLAQMANLNTTYFSQAFKDKTGVTPYEFLLQIRFSTAKNMLLNTDKSCSEIADEVGFNSLSHFIYAFRNRYHITPNGFRKENRRLIEKHLNELI